jgi:hypothetical protein
MNPSSDKEDGATVSRRTAKSACLLPLFVSPHALIISAWIKSLWVLEAAEFLVWENVSVPCGNVIAQ